MSVSGDSAIINAEKRMGFSLGSSPWIIQLYLLGFTLGPLIAGLGISRYLAGANPKALAEAPGQGVIFAGVIYGAILVFLLQTYALAHASKWFELSYCGDVADEDWAHTFRFKTAVDLGEAIPLSIPEQGGPPAKWGDRKWGIQRPNLKVIEKGHCWEISFFDKTLPLLLGWLPPGENFDTCFSFKNHSVQAWCRTLPFQIEDGTRGTFIRTSWTQDPNGTVIPVGVFSHNDYVVRKIRQELEPIEIPKGEAQALAQTRDNYYRHGLALELDFAKKEIEILKKQLARTDDDGYEKAGALFQAAKGRHKKEPQKISITTSRRTQIIILVLALGLTVLGGLAAVTGGRVP